MAFELELPAVYLEAVLLDPTPATPVVINRDPEPAETQVPIGASIALDVTDLGPNGIDVAATQVFVGGVLAFSGGVFQPGYTGPASATSNPQPDTLRIVVDPLPPFESLEVVTVRVVTQTVGGGAQLDASWSFTCEDLTAPHVVGAQARELGRVRVSFDESVKQESALDPDDALNPSLYSLVRASAPAVEASVVGVEPVTNASVDLLTDIALTPGALYRVTVTGVVDAFGNPVLAPNNMADFVGFQPARPARRRLELYQLLPMLNRREDQTGDLRRFLLCLQEVTDLLLADIDRFTDILDPDIAPEPFVDLMLRDLGSPFPFDLALPDKRRLLNVLVAVYREKGTSIGIRNAIRFFLGLEVEILSYAGEALILGDSLLGEDWILGASGAFSAYAFDVVSPRALTAEERKRVRLIVDYMKPAHTHFRLVEPVIPEVIDHLELGLSELGETWLLH
jgi:phage tail-like protein